ncbi:MAG TPA: TIGR01244 family sulfur transferase [Pseudomonadales bacterium]|nr:TIGR01244 family sulfur transferase [Pseudomonadales bacterium]
MSAVEIDDGLAVCGQLGLEDLDALAADGVRRVLCLRPDDEAGDYPSSDALAARAEALGMHFVNVPVSGLDVTPEAIAAVSEAVAAPGAAVAYCRSGRRVALAWALSRVAQGEDVDRVLGRAAAAGFDLSALADRLHAHAATVGDDTLAANAETVRRAAPGSARRFDVVIVGGGSAGLATAASLLRRRGSLQIAVIEPEGDHHYQPGLTLVGAGHFDPARITRREADVMPKGVHWIRTAAQDFDPERHEVELADGSRVAYGALVVAPGLELHWDGIEGAREALGSNGVCSNYSPAHAAYTFERVRTLRSGRALFTQPAMPIKCAGAPQKAVYLSCDRWREMGVLDDLDVQFHNAGGVLFGVEHFVPVLTGYMQDYGVELCFKSTLTAIDGPGRTATFRGQDADGAERTRTLDFDFLHFVPPQRAPALVRDSVLADADGWLAVDSQTLQHPLFPDVFGAGDVVGTANAKTMAAARKHAPIVAENLLAQLDGRPLPMGYDGYGACPLTVEAGRVVLAEFGYGGRLLPTFPLDPTVPRRSQWLLKRRLMPIIYWDLMLKGREWFARPRPRESVS